METNEKIKVLKIRAWENAFHCFATAVIFEKRAKCLILKIRLLQCLGIAVPLSVGSIVIYFGTDNIGFLLGVAGALAVVQFIITVWALVNKWDENHAYSVKSTIDNHRLYYQYKELGEDPIDDENKLRGSLELLKIADSYRSSEDYAQHISEEEKRYGHRAALRQTQKECTACKKIPQSMIPSNCGICGNYKKWRRLL